MREEDEIRAAVVALADQLEQGDTTGIWIKSAGLGSCIEETSQGCRDSGTDQDSQKSQDCQESQDTQENQAAQKSQARSLDEELEDLSAEDQQAYVRGRVFEAVRTQTRAGRLSQPHEWEAQGLIPSTMTSEDVEMAIYDYLREASRQRSLLDKTTENQAGSAAGTKASSGKAVVPRRSTVTSSATRGVGMPAFMRPVEELKKVFASAADMQEETVNVSDVQEESAGAAGVQEVVVNAGEAQRSPVSVAETQQPSTDVADKEKVPGEESSSALEACENPCDLHSSADRYHDCCGIVLLEGAHSYYLYDASYMTDAYAHWAFLAAEDNPVTTFIECVREESSVYPRPMALTALTNDPFRMSVQEIEAAYVAAQETGRDEDIERTVASNGDVFFYSTKYLSSAQATSLAEWIAVERKRNV